MAQDSSNDTSADGTPIMTGPTSMIRNTSPGGPVDIKGSDPSIPPHTQKKDTAVNPQNPTLDLGGASSTFSSSGCFPWNESMATSSVLTLISPLFTCIFRQSPVSLKLPLHKTLE
eukprot:m.3733 g.3733  ORF g.3733 m.3733 type:complete len:115 (+) comp2819_c0_seq2:1574-1918(+)